MDYTVPSEAEITQALGRIRDPFVRSTPYRVIDTATGQPLTSLTTPPRTSGIDLSSGEFNDWTYSMGVVLAGMLPATDVTGDRSFEEYTRKNFDFIVNHLEFFRRQAKEFGPQSYGYRRLLEMRELDDGGAIGAAPVTPSSGRRMPGSGLCPGRGWLVEQDPLSNSRGEPFRRSSPWLPLLAQGRPSGRRGVGQASPTTPPSTARSSTARGSTSARRSRAA